MWDFLRLQQNSGNEFDGIYQFKFQIFFDEMGQCFQTSVMSTDILRRININSNSGENGLRQVSEKIAKVKKLLGKGARKPNEVSFPSPTVT
jgi:hypothetical protein